MLKRQHQLQATDLWKPLSLCLLGSTGPGNSLLTVSFILLSAPTQSPSNPLSLSFHPLTSSWELGSPKDRLPLWPWPWILPGASRPHPSWDRILDELRSRRCPESKLLSPTRPHVREASESSWVWNRWPLCPEIPQRTLEQDNQDSPKEDTWRTYRTSSP